jgi:hypothetical protein
MPVQKVKLSALPKSKRSKVTGTPEYIDIQSQLIGVQKDEALRVSLSKETVALFKNKNVKTAIAAFRQSFLADPEYKSRFRVGVIGDELIVKHRLDKAKSK